MSEETADVFSHLRLHLFEEGLDLGSCQFLKEVCGLARGHLFKNIRGLFRGEVLDQLDLNLGVGLFKDLCGHIDVQSAKNAGPFRSIQVFQNICQVRRV